MGRRWWAFGVAAVALVAMAGCGGGGGGGGEAAEPASTEPPVTVADPTTTVLSEEDAVLAAYQGYWDTWLAANDPPNPDHPDLAKYATGAALTKVRDSVSTHKQLRQVVQLPPGSVWRHEARVSRLTGASAVVVDCNVDDSLLIDEPSGQVLDDAVASFSTTAVLSRVEGSWRVASVTADEQWDGVAGCAA
jgi:hypothetical protein